MYFIKPKQLFNTALITSTLVGSTIYASELYEGPIGDKWYPISELVIPAEGLELTKDTVLNVDRLILKGDIVTKGHRLKINAHEINFENSSQVIGFKEAQVPQNMTPPPYESAAIQGSHSNSRYSKGGDGGNGASGRNGFDGIEGRQDSKEINIFSLSYNGKIKINGNGEKGGKGGKGGQGQDGGLGGNGINAHSAPDCNPFSGHDGYEGTNGGRGGFPGAPGIGGQGGMGGNNIPVKLYSALVLSPTRYNIESELGLPGNAGDAGVWGNPGAGGPGGGSANKKKDCFMDLRIFTAEDPRRGGSDGASQDYPKAYKNQKLKEAKGKVGPPNMNKVTQIEKTFFQELRERQLAVYDNAYRFHYSRLFQFLIQDGIRIATQSQFTRSMLGMIDQEILESMIQSDIILIDKLIHYWNSYFIQRLEQEEELSFEKEEYLELAMDFVSLLTSLKGQNLTAEQMLLDWNSKLGVITDKTSMEILTLNKSCTIFLKSKKNAFAGELPFTDMFNVPICSKAEMQNLVKDPTSPIKLVAQRSQEYIFPSSAIPLKVNLLERTLKDGDRQPLSSNPFQVVIVNNRRYTLGDFQTLRDTNQNEISDRGLLESLNTFPEHEVTINSYPKFIKILLNGL